MPVPIELIPADERDIADIVALHAAAAAHLSDISSGCPPSSPLPAELVRIMVSDGSTLIARGDSGLLASLRLMPYGGTPSFFTEAKHPLRLLNMAVAPANQRQGVGRGCLQEVDRLARAWGADSVRLDARVGPCGAAPFYAKCGYDEVGRDVNSAYFERILEPRLQDTSGPPGA